MQPFQTPPLLDKLTRQPVQKFGMGWRESLQAEIAGSTHQASAEMMVPDPVHHHPGGETIVG